MAFSFSTFISYLRLSSSRLTSLIAFPPERKAKWLRLMGMYQHSTAFFVIVIWLLTLVADAFTWQHTLFAVVAIGLNMSAGYGLIKHKLSWFWLSYLNAGLQVPFVTIGSFSGVYSGLGGMYLVLEWAEKLSWAAPVLSFSAKFSPGFTWHIADAPFAAQSLGIDLFALGFIALLWLLRSIDDEMAGD